MSALLPGRCCGIEGHKKSIQVHVLVPQGKTQIKPVEREYRTFSRDLRRLRGWLSDPQGRHSYSFENCCFENCLLYVVDSGAEAESGACSFWLRAWMQAMPHLAQWEQGLAGSGGSL